jgi:hypothetical protein
MAKPTKVDLEVVRGDTKRIVFNAKDEDGVAINIASWSSILMTIISEKNPTDDSNQVAQLTGTIATDGSDGKMYFNPDPSVEVGKYYYDCQAIDNNTEKVTFVEGSFKVLQDRTKD